MLVTKKSGERTLEFESLEQCFYPYNSMRDSSPRQNGDAMQNFGRISRICTFFGREPRCNLSLGISQVDVGNCFSSLDNWMLRHEVLYGQAGSKPDICKAVLAS
jgi:hypothetical protein